MQMDSSASLTGSEPASAVEWAITARMPISRHVRRMRSAISPRFAIRILWNTLMDRWDQGGPSERSPIPLPARLDQKERLPVLDGLSVFDQDLHDAARRLRLDLVHQLHRLDDAEDLVLLDDVAFADEGSGVGG